MIEPTYKTLCYRRYKFLNPSKRNNKFCFTCFEIYKEQPVIIRQCNIRNYSIFHKDYLLFAYFEYVGDDFAAVFPRPRAHVHQPVAPLIERPPAGDPRGLAVPEGL